MLKFLFFLNALFLFFQPLYTCTYYNLEYTQYPCAVKIKLSECDSNMII